MRLLNILTEEVNKLLEEAYLVPLGESKSKGELSDRDEDKDEDLYIG